MSQTGSILAPLQENFARQPGHLAPIEPCPANTEIENLSDRNQLFMLLQVEPYPDPHLQAVFESRLQPWLFCLHPDPIPRRSLRRALNTSRPAWCFLWRDTPALVVRELTDYRSVGYAVF